MTTSYLHHTRVFIYADDFLWRCSSCELSAVAERTDGLNPKTSQSSDPTMASPPCALLFRTLQCSHHYISSIPHVYIPTAVLLTTYFGRLKKWQKEALADRPTCRSVRAWPQSTSQHTTSIRIACHSQARLAPFSTSSSTPSTPSSSPAAASPSALATSEPELASSGSSI